MRESHAKWFEIPMTKGTFVMTGSINATEQSFASTKNVEVSLARKLETHSMKWKKAIPREIRYTPFVPGKKEDGIGVVDAILRANGVLVGVVSYVDFSLGEIRAELLQEGIQLQEVVSTNLEEGGVFKCRVDSKCTETHAGLQIRVNGKDFSALGWVSNELQLDATEADRKKMAAVNRILSSSFGADDVYELISLLMDYTNNPVVRPKSKPQSNKEQTSKDPVPFTLESWLKSGDSHGRSGLIDVASGRSFDALYSWLNGESRVQSMGQNDDRSGNQRNGRGTKIDKHKGHSILSDVPWGESGSASSNAKEERIQRMVGKLLEMIPKRLQENPEHRWSVELLRVLSAFAVRNAMRGAFSDSSHTFAAQACLSWLDTLLKVNLKKSDLELLESTIVAMGCIAIWFTEGEVSASVASKVKEGFQQVGINVGSGNKLESVCRDGIKHKAFAPIVAIADDKLFDSVNTILATKNSIDVVTQILERLHQSQFTQLTSSERQVVGKDFEEALIRFARGAKNRFGLIKDIEVASVGCPCCYMALKKETVKQLRQSHVAVCTNMSCKRALVWLSANNNA